MRFETPDGATLFAAEIRSDRRHGFNQDLKTGLSVIWNTGADAMFMIDREELLLRTDCMLFLTEYHRVDNFEFESMNVLQFNRPFYCMQDDDDEVGCKGALFFGASNLPTVEIPATRRRQFGIVWEAILMELDEMDDYKYEMLQALLRRWLILSLRLYRKQLQYISDDNPGLKLIKEFNYLVEQHFMRLSKVTDYARLLHRSPKTLTNTFRKYIDQSPLQVINERRYLEARRQLVYTDRSVKEIALDINFRDLQSFSHFFHQRAGCSPSEYRGSLKGTMNNR